MKVPQIKKIKRAAWRIKEKFSPRTLILLYHRVTELPTDPQLLAVTPAHFAEHLEVLQKYGQILSLRQLTSALQQGKLPDKTIVVTFDDGYADNFYHAKPLLEQYEIPATIFVAAGQIGQKSEFWWDELDRLFLQPGRLPDQGHLNIRGNIVKWEMGEAAHYDEQTFETYRQWNITDNVDPSSRQKLYRLLFHEIRNLPNNERNEALASLQRWASVDAAGRTSHHTLTKEELICLANSDFIEIGAHTVTHPILSVLPLEKQAAEIQQSKACLESVLGFPVTSFSYPSGGRADYMTTTVTLTREAGFSSSCSAFAGYVYPHSDMFQLPRFVVRDWNKAEFSDRLARWVNG